MTSAFRPAPPPVPSHSHFLRAQIKSSLAHLYATNDLDEGSYRKIETILAGNDITPAETNKSQNDDELKIAAKKLATDKNWLRHVLIETNSIANTVSMALSVAVPSAIIGSAQRAAIVELVTLSQKKIANAITDPNWQMKTKDATFAGAKGAGSGIKKGFNAAGQSLESVSKKREDMKRNAEQRKAEKREQKEIKKELKREREEIAQKRQGINLGSVEAMSRTSSKDNGSRRASNADSALASVDTALPKSGSGGSESVVRKSSPRNASYAPGEGALPATDMNGDAMVSVSCSEMASQGSVAATTTFSPWPGLLITSTLVATNDDELGEDDEDDDSEEIYEASTQQNRPHISESNLKDFDSTAAIPPPPRRPAPSSSLGRGDGEMDQSMRLQGDRSTSSGTAPHFPQQDTNEVIDTTESKQKSWTKKLGL